MYFNSKTVMVISAAALAYFFASVGFAQSRESSPVWYQKEGWFDSRGISWESQGRAMAPETDGLGSQIFHVGRLLDGSFRPIEKGKFEWATEIGSGSSALFYSDREVECIDLQKKQLQIAQKTERYKSFRVKAFLEEVSVSLAFGSRVIDRDSVDEWRALNSARQMAESFERVIVNDVIYEIEPAGQAGLVKKRGVQLVISPLFMTIASTTSLRNARPKEFLAATCKVVSASEILAAIGNYIDSNEVGVNPYGTEVHDRRSREPVRATGIAR